MPSEESAAVHSDTSSRRVSGSPITRVTGSTLDRMVDSPPSQGTSARDPEHPASEGRCAGDSDVGGEGDDEWVRAIEALAARVDPVPEDVLQAARRALHARDPKREDET